MYGDTATGLPAAHLPELARQVEAQTRRYEVREEAVEVALALVKPSGFTRQVEDGAEVYTAEISYPVDRQGLLTSWETLKRRDPAGFGFHYDPYNFDSGPEQSFFDQLLDHLNLHPDQVEDIYFTGALTTPDKTDFCRGLPGRRRQMASLHPRLHHPAQRWQSADCRNQERTVQGRRPRKTCAAPRAVRSAVSIEGRKAVALQAWEVLNPDRLRYELVFVRDDTIGYDQTAQYVISSDELS